MPRQPANGIRSTPTHHQQPTDTPETDAESAIACLVYPTRQRFATSASFRSVWLESRRRKGPSRGECLGIRLDAFDRLHLADNQGLLVGRDR